MSLGFNNAPVNWGGNIQWGNYQAPQILAQGMAQLGQGLAQGIQGYRERVQKKKNEEAAVNVLKGLDPKILQSVGITEDMKGDDAALKAALKGVGGPEKFLASISEYQQRAQQLEMQEQRLGIEKQQLDEMINARNEDRKLKMDALAAEIENNRTRNRIAETDSLARLTQYANEASPFRMSAQPVLDPTGSPVVGPDGKPLMSLNTSPRSAMLAPAADTASGVNPTASMQNAAAAKAALKDGDYLTVVSLIGRDAFPGLQDAASMGPEEAKKYIKDMAELWLGKAPSVDPKKNGDEQSQSGGMMTTSSGARWSIKK